MTAGDPERGRELGCNACHTIPGAPTPSMPDLGLPDDPIDDIVGGLFTLR